MGEISTKQMEEYSAIRDLPVLSDPNSIMSRLPERLFLRGQDDDIEDSSEMQQLLQRSQELLCSVFPIEPADLTDPVRFRSFFSQLKIGEEDYSSFVDYQPDASNIGLCTLDIADKIMGRLNDRADAKGVIFKPVTFVRGSEVHVPVPELPAPVKKPNLWKNMMHKAFHRYQDTYRVYEAEKSEYERIETLRTKAEEAKAEQKKASDNAKRDELRAYAKQKKPKQTHRIFRFFLILIMTLYMHWVLQSKISLRIKLKVPLYENLPNLKLLMVWQH